MEIKCQEQGTVRKELLKASKSSGQTKLSFSTQSVVANDNAEHDYTPQMIMLLLVQVKPPPLQ